MQRAIQPVGRQGLRARIESMILLDLFDRCASKFI